MKINILMFTEEERKKNHPQNLKLKKMDLCVIKIILCFCVTKTNNGL